MGDPPFNNSQIDRIENDKGYCKSNCKWSSSSENNFNRGNYGKYKKGVSLNLGSGNKTKVWATALNIEGKRVWIGRFATEEEAHQAYLLNYKEWFGKNATL